MELNDWEAVKIWGVIALLCAAVSAVEMGCGVWWLTQRERVMWQKQMDSDARITLLEGRQRLVEKDLDGN